MALEINHVAIASFSLRAKKMVECYFIQRRRRCKCRDVAADPLLNLVGAYDHRQRVPAHQALDPSLHLLTAGERRLLPYRNRVLVRSSRSEGKIDARFPPRMQSKLLQQSASPVRAAT